MYRALGDLHGVAAALTYRVLIAGFERDPGRLAPLKAAPESKVTTNRRGGATACKLDQRFSPNSKARRPRCSSTRLRDGLELWRKQVNG